MTPMSPIDRQLAREVIMMNRGITRYFDRQWREVRNKLGETHAAKKALPLLLPEVRDNIVKLVSEAVDCGGRRPVWVPVFRDIDCYESLAAVALRVALGGAQRRAPLVGIIESMGREVELAHALRAMEDVRTKGGKRLGPNGVHKRMIELAKVGRSHLVKVMMREVGVKPWDMETRVLHGQVLLNALLLTDNFLVSSEGSREDQRDYLVLSESAQALITEIDIEEAWLRPAFSPMVVPPRPWVGFNEGGYLTHGLRDTLPFVRHSTKEATREYRKAFKSGAMKGAVDAVNAIQATPLSMDPFIIDLTEWAYDEGLSVKKLPRRDPVVVPDLPEDFDSLEKSVKYRLFQQRKAAIQFNQQLRSRQAGLKVDIADARNLVGETVYLPHNLDWRGRVYPVCHLSHHRADYVKAWFRFHNKVPLGSAGLQWLRVHLANMGDFDRVSKASFEDRILWCVRNYDLIARVANDPRTNLEWLRADKPFSFVQACREYIDAMSYPEGPENYPSSIVTDLDGSNSGIQHYSAALRSREEAAYVNLVPMDKPGDFYGTISKAVEAVVASEASKYPGTAEEARSLLLEALEATRANREDPDHECHGVLQTLLAKLWMDYGLTRSIVKRNVMTYVYSAGTFGFRDQLLSDLMEPIGIEVIEGKRVEHPFGGDEGRSAASYLAKRVYASVVHHLPKAEEGMRYFQKLAALLAHEQQGVWWETLDGFPVHQCYREYATKRVRLTLYNRDIPVWDRNPAQDRVFDGDKVLRRYQASVVMGTDKKVIKHSQRNAIAPNVVHSSDATHLRMSVLDAREKGITDVMLIHDSFGCHAANLGDFADSIRFSMAALYSQWSPFTAVRDRAIEVLSEKQRAKVPEAPAFGDLDLVEDVMNAKYAFC